MPNLTFSTTADGSQTIFNAEVGEFYHSRHGALQESQHVFLQSGLAYFLEENTSPNASVLEVGFGTGLNFLLTADYCRSSRVNVNYVGIEANPLPLTMISETAYEKYVSDDTWRAFLAKYENSLNSPVSISEYCSLKVAHCKLMDFSSNRKFDVIYFDAFAAVHQPEMWTHESLSHVCSFINPGGVFVTYAITGNLKRSMKALGFSIEKAPGAPGKREMLRAVKR
ncbi:tRNA (5-methylaminomethyl-2-thiouridine)(34)-methyltransferase MnmD [Flavihumibacter sp. R14]|nr:tRNA (5-methylaminomethyl-2-thiouridine)(34)-methyltransferase MnmD [Flavihumibacter soli]